MSRAWQEWAADRTMLVGVTLMFVALPAAFITDWPVAIGAALVGLVLFVVGAVAGLWVSR